MTTLGSIFALGLLAGTGHAFEADHVAAVSSIVAGDRSRGSALGHGLSWGLGHTLTLLLFSGAALALGRAIPGTIEARFEQVVGVMLVLLGGQLIWRMMREKVHFHGHHHPQTGAHFHGHSHRDDPAPHRESHHHHDHRFSPRAMVVGMVHGLAGSAALLVVAATRIADWRDGVIYIVLFGLGSMLGMGMLSAAIGLPLRLAERWLTRVSHAMQCGLASLTIFIGASAIVHHM